MPVRAFSPQEIRSGRRRLEQSLLLTVLLASALFSLAEGRALLLLLTAGAAMVHLAAAERHREIYIRRIALNVSVLVVGAALAVRYFLTRQDLLIALGHYVTLIQICKLFEQKKDRDYIQMIVMSLLLVLAGGMICQELLFAVVGVAYIASLCLTGMIFTIKRSLDLAESRLPAAEGEGPAAARPWPRRVLLSRLVVVLVAVLSTGVVVFLIAPRSLGGPTPPLRRAARQVSSGFSDTVRLGEPRSIYLSDRVVMQVRFISPDGLDLGPVASPYLRGRVFMEYVDSEWAAPPQSVRAPPVPAPPRLLDRAIRQETSMMPLLLPTAFAGYPAVRVVSPDAAVHQLSDLQYELTSPPPGERPLRYVAYVLTGQRTAEELEYLREASGPPAPMPARAASARVGELARQWCQDLLAERPAAQGPPRDAVDLKIARRLAERLKDRCSYTLDLADADPEVDGVEDFLFRLRRGHCEYFASALTVMCQHLGVRARLAAGLCPSEYDSTNMRYVVRQRDAHAWTELYTPSTDWTIVDATPAERFAAYAQSSWGRWGARAQELWSEWEFAWYSKVVAYDDDDRRAMAAQVRRHLRETWQALGGAAGEAFWGLVELFARGHVNPAARRVLIGLAGAALAGAGLLALRQWKRPARRRRTSPPAPKPPPFLRHLLALLRRHGLRPRPHQTAREWAEEAAGRLNLPAEGLQELVGLYYLSRWGGRPIPPADAAAAERQVRRLAEILST